MPFNSTEFPAQITAFKISGDWGAIETDGPLHCVLNIEGFPAVPFSAGTFQLAFKASSVLQNKYLDAKTQYVVKQHKLDSCGLSETLEIDNLSAEAKDDVDAECERRSAKVHYFFLSR